MSHDQELVQLFGSKGREVEALQKLVGGVTATYLRTVEIGASTFAALVEGLSDPNPRVRWWCVQVLDHVSDERAVGAIASVLDDPVPRVRRNAAHALGCVACKPEWVGGLPDQITEKLTVVAESDANEKVRSEARLALSCQNRP